MARSPQSVSFDYCDETCPAVSRVVSEFIDGEFERFIDKVKEVSSYKLREALISACEDLQQAEQEIKELKAEIDQKDDEIASLRDHIRELESVETEVS